MHDSFLKVNVVDSQHNERCEYVKIRCSCFFSKIIISPAVSDLKDDVKGACDADDIALDRMSREGWQGRPLVDRGKVYGWAFSIIHILRRSDVTQI